MFRDLLFYTFAFSAFIPIYQAYRSPSRLYELPFLYGVACYVFIIPTLFFVKDDSYLLTDVEFNRYLLNAIICFWGALAGYYSINTQQKYTQISRQQIVKYNESKMFFALLPFIIIGIIGSTLIDPSEFGNEKGGVFAIILFFSRFFRPAAIILLILYLLRPDIKKVTFLLIFLFFSLQFILISGRRSEVFNLALTIMFPLFFIKNIVIPRAFIIPSLILAILVIAIFPTAREFTKRGDYDRLYSLSLTDLSREYLSGEKTNEVIEAAKNMDVVSRADVFYYGTSFYNSLIHQYASSTLFGNEFKQSLRINSNADLTSLRAKYWSGSVSGFKGYLSHTGFAGMYFEFGWFAVIFFFFFGRITKQFFVKAYCGKDIHWISFYCSFTTFILISIYHSMVSIPTMIIPYLLVLYTIKSISKKKDSQYNKVKYA
uniref:Oligosaccharide repeat unit polymerase n=1 Tax=Roseihalotalea indica TaxID=2867963 RepID=A0AA49GLY1_9BACT|nr:hypothetical protein K4G66_19090 [Tunicatimonas sp. TK19036]WKN34636.1 hypothetical protein K4G66_19880 [Tunicatimonas sp. TK19036]